MKKTQHIEKIVTSKKPEIQPASQNSKREMDCCVMCGKETIYPKDIHIDFRFDYIEGAGQLCKECANKINNNGGTNRA